MLHSIVRNGRKIAIFFVTVLFIGGLLFAPTQAATLIGERQLPAAKHVASKTVPNELLIQLKQPFSTFAQHDSSLQKFRSVVRQVIGDLEFKPVTRDDAVIGRGLYQVRLPAGADIEKISAYLEKQELVEYVEANHLYEITRRLPNDESLGNQWHLDQDSDVDIDAPEAWDLETGGGEIVVAVIDSGVDTDHPDLVNRIWSGVGYDFVDNDSNPNPAPNGLDEDSDTYTDDGVTHGTHVAGIIAAQGNNSEGITGVSWNSKIMAVRALDDEGFGTDADIIEGINYAVENGADVINMSFGSSVSTSPFEEAVEDAVEAGVAMIAAVGNSALNLNTIPFYPACYDGVIGVAASNSADNAAWFSNYGSDCVDITAPGTSIYSTLYTNDPTYDFTDDYGYMSGTSMAAPVVAGAAALLLEQNSALTATQVATYLTENAEDVGLDSDMGAGRLNLYDALAAAAGSATAPTNLKAYTNSAKTTQISASTRTNEKTPYFTWGAGSASGGVSGYYVYFGDESDAEPVVDGAFQSGRSYSASSISGNGHNYYLRIQTKGQNGALSSVASFTYLIDSQVNRISDYEVDNAETGVLVSSDAYIDSDAVAVKIYRRTGSSGSYQYLAQAEIDDDGFSYYDTTARDGRSYSYKLRVVDDVGNVSDDSPVQTQKYAEQDRIIVAAGKGGGPQVRVFDVDGHLLSSFFAYDQNFRGGINVASCDLDGNGNAEIIVGTGVGGGPQVRVFDHEGHTKFTNGFFAYGENFRGGVYVACGDLDGDGRAEIVTGTGVGGGPQIRVFDRFGNPTISNGFFAYGENFRGGVIPAVGDLDGDGRADIIAGTGPTGGPQVRTFDGTGRLLFTPGFFAYNEFFRGGVRVTAADVDGNGKAEIITGPGPGGGPHVRIFNRFGVPVFSAGGFMAYDSSFRGGIVLSALDVNQDGRDEIMTGVGSQGAPLIRAFSYSGNNAIDEFMGFADNFFGGMSVVNGYN